MMTPLFPDFPSDETAAESPLEGMSPPRLLKANRSQLFLRPTSLEDSLPPDHLARTVWELVADLDLSGLLAHVRAVEGHRGHPAIDPRLLLAVWAYGLSQGVGSARALDRLCTEHDAYRWLLGGVTVNYHTLSDFRGQHADALEALFSDILAALQFDGLVTLERVAQDGMRVRASAGDASFRREATLQQCLTDAQAHVRKLAAQLDAADTSPSPRRRKAAERAARERLQRVRQALAELPKIRTAQKVKDPENARASMTDPEARVMKMGDAGFRPAFNVQFATDCASQLIVGVDVVNTGSDRAQLLPMLDQLERRFHRLPGVMLADGGFASHLAVEQTDQRGVLLYAPVEQSKIRGLDRYTPRADDSPAVAQWRQRMATPEAHDIYKDRAATAECVNALARLRGLRCFLLRSLQKVRCFTLLVTIVHNLLRSHSLRLSRAAT